MSSFVYIWSNISTNQKYIGVHKGTPDDGYICSSKTMIEDYHKNSNIFERTIVAYGTFDEMYELESKMLREVDAAKNPQYYNQSNNNGKFYMTRMPQSGKEKLRQKALGRPSPTKGIPNPEQKERFLKNNPMKNPEIAAKVSSSKKGKPSPLKTTKTFTWSCSWCDKSHISLDNHDYRNKKRPKVFCNKSCAASYSNTYRYISHPPADEQANV